jgi:hypothetical protein
MNLVPIRPPGPNARKARSFSLEILQLRAQGYTFEAIREALAAAGVRVSNSTVQREAARAAGHPPAAASADEAGGHRRASQPVPPPGASAHASEPASSSAPASPAIRRDARSGKSAGRISGKESAEAFFNAHPSNPLFPAKEST